MDQTDTTGDNVDINIPVKIPADGTGVVEPTPEAMPEIPVEGGEAAA